MPRSSGPKVQLAQARTTGTNDVGAERLAPQNVPQAARNEPTVAPPFAFMEMPVNSGLRKVSQTKQTLSKYFIKKIHVHIPNILQLFAKSLLSDYNIHTKF